MGLFYKVPPYIEPVYSSISSVMSQVSLTAKGYETPGFLEELMPEAELQMHAARERLITEGREKALGDFRKHVLKVGRVMDNAPYNRIFRPWIMEHL